MFLLHVPFTQNGRRAGRRREKETGGETEDRDWGGLDGREKDEKGREMSFLQPV